MQTQKPAGGFSLIELVVSMALVLTFAGLYLGGGRKGYEAKLKARCAEQLQAQGLALSLYAQEHDGAFPSLPGASSAEAPLSLLVPQYTTDTSLFICPAQGASALPPAVPFADRRISYAYYMGVKNGPDAGSLPLVSDSQVNTAPRRRSGALFTGRHGTLGGNHRSGAGNFLFVDDHVEAFEKDAPRDLSTPAGIELLNPKP